MDRYSSYINRPENDVFDQNSKNIFKELEQFDRFFLDNVVRSCIPSHTMEPLIIYKYTMHVTITSGLSSSVSSSIWLWSLF